MEGAREGGGGNDVVGLAVGRPRNAETAPLVPVSPLMRGARFAPLFCIPRLPPISTYISPLFSIVPSVVAVPPCPGVGNRSPSSAFRKLKRALAMAATSAVGERIVKRCQLAATQCLCPLTLYPASFVLPPDRTKRGARRYSRRESPDVA